METETERRDDSFWRDYPAMVQYFSPGIVPLLRYLGLGSKGVLHAFGEQVGRAAAAKMSDLSLSEMLDELAGVWQKNGMGTLSVESRNPLVLQISNCAVCGQLQGTGDMYECAFHEGFFQGALSMMAGKTVNLHQETNFEGEAGTWCRRLVVDLSL